MENGIGCSKRRFIIGSLIQVNSSQCKLTWRVRTAVSRKLSLNMRELAILQPSEHTVRMFILLSEVGTICSVCSKLTKAKDCPLKWLSWLALLPCKKRNLSPDQMWIAIVCPGFIQQLREGVAGSILEHVFTKINIEQT